MTSAAASTKRHASRHVRFEDSEDDEPVPGHAGLTTRDLKERAAEIVDLEGEEDEDDDDLDEEEDEEDDDEDYSSGEDIEGGEALEEEILERLDTISQVGQRR